MINFKGITSNFNEDVETTNILNFNINQPKVILPVNNLNDGYFNNDNQIIQVQGQAPVYYTTINRLFIQRTKSILPFNITTIHLDHDNIVLTQDRTNYTYLYTPGLLKFPRNINNYLDHVGQNANFPNWLIDDSGFRDPQQIVNFRTHKYDFINFYIKISSILLYNPFKMLFTHSNIHTYHIIYEFLPNNLDSAYFSKIPFEDKYSDPYTFQEYLQEDIDFINQNQLLLSTFQETFHLALNLIENSSLRSYHYYLLSLIYANYYYEYQQLKNDQNFMNCLRSVNIIYQDMEQWFSYRPTHDLSEFRNFIFNHDPLNNNIDLYTINKAFILDIDNYINNNQLNHNGILSPILDHMYPKPSTMSIFLDYFQSKRILPIYVNYLQLVSPSKRNEVNILVNEKYFTVHPNSIQITGSQPMRPVNRQNVRSIQHGGQNQTTVIMLTNRILPPLDLARTGITLPPNNNQITNLPVNQNTIVKAVANQNYTDDIRYNQAGNETISLITPDLLVLNHFLTNNIPANNITMLIFTLHPMAFEDNNHQLMEMHVNINIEMLVL
jgi:hypothetical protein